jgi:ribosome modulation factor
MSKKSLKKSSETVVQEGRTAFLNGEPKENNPYIKGDSFRTLWFEGWYSEETNKRLAHVFVKYNIKL